jgi:CheY-like chemotaxis protein
VNGVDAIEKTQISAPDLVISDTVMPEMDGFELNRLLKANPDWADIPVIFLTAQKSVEDRIRGLEQGVEDYLTKPIFIREILARVGVVLQRRQRETLESRGSKTKFSGNLADMGIIDLIQTIEISRKSGVIHLVKSDDRGEIYFRDGNVIDAETRNRRGPDAVYRMLVWSDGMFEIEFVALDKPDRIQLSTQALLMEGMRRLDEWGRLLEQLPPLTAVFDVDEGALAERLGEIPDELNGLLRHFDGKRDLMGVVDVGSLSDLEALTVITKLYFEGLIRETFAASDDEPDAAEEHDAYLPGDAPEHLASPRPPAPARDDIHTRVTSPPPRPAPVEKAKDGEVPSTLRLPRIELFPKGERPSKAYRGTGFVEALSQARASAASVTVPVAVPPAPAPPPQKAPVPPPPPAAPAAEVKAEQPPDSKAKLIAALDAAAPPPMIEPAPPEGEEIYFKGEAYSREFGGSKAEPRADNTEKSTELRLEDLTPLTPREAEDELQRLLEEEQWKERRGAKGSAKPFILGLLALMLIGGGAYAVWRLTSDPGVIDFDKAPIRQPDVGKALPIEDEPEPAAVPAHPAVRDAGVGIAIEQPAPQPEPQKEPTPQPPPQPEPAVQPPAVQPPAAGATAYAELLKKALGSPKKKKVELLEEALAIDPQGHEALAELAITLMESGKTRAEALDYGLRATAADPGDAKAWLAIGYIHQLNNEVAKSREAYQKCAAAAGPKDFVRECKQLLR